MEDSSALVFSRKALENAAKQAPSLMINLFFALAMRMNECIRTVDFLALKEIPQRLAAYLIFSLKKSGGGDVLPLPFSQKELSKVLGTTPETLCRVIARMVREKAIKVKGRQITVVNHKLLEDMTHEMQ